MSAEKELDALISLLKECKTQTEYREMIRDYAKGIADRQSVELLEWVRVILIEFPNSRWTICIDDVEKLTSPELLAKFHENRKKA